LLSVGEWAGLTGLVAVMRLTGAVGDYASAVAQALEENSSCFRADTARAILRKPDSFIGALRRMGQPTLLAAWEEHWECVRS